MFDLHVIYRAAMLSQVDTTGTLFLFPKHTINILFIQ